MSTLKDLRDIRLQKLNKLRKLGIDPYPSSSFKEEDNATVVNDFDTYDGRMLTLAGRLMSWREHGPLIFADLVDESGKIQLYIKKDELEETSKEKQTVGFDDLNLLDVGDFVQATGKITRTQRGEISLQPTQITLLSKSLRPLPDKHDGLKDPETRFRRRYLELATVPEVRKRFIRKSKFWDANRMFLKDRGFIEFETPILEHVTGGADAKPFVTHHNALNQDFFLRISSELYQKRLIGGGFEKVFVFGPNFRNEGIDDEHLQEYYDIEWYWAYADFRDNMELVKEMFRYIAQEVYGTTKFTKGEHKFDLADEWTEIDYVEVIKKRYGIDIFKDSEDKMWSVLKEEGVEISGNTNRQRLVDNLWKTIRKNVSGPAFLINTPKFISPLAKSTPENDNTTERFQVILAGSELGNGYTELNDPLDQLERFKAQQEARDAGDEEAQMLDIDYVEMLEYGMPPTSGYGQSERIFWFFENLTAREATLFPQMRFKLDSTTKQIYGLDEADFESSNKSTQPTLDIPEKIKISSSVKKKWPTFRVGYAEISGVNIEEKTGGLEELKKDYLKQFSRLTKGDLDNFPEIRSYRKAYKEMGVKLHSRKPSPEALLLRLIKGKDLYNVNTCIDAINLIVMKYRVSLGAFDLDKIKFPIKVAVSDGNDEIVLLGDEEPTEIKRGEVCYYDSTGPFNLDINYRDSDRTKVTQETKNIMVNVDGLHSISRDRVEQSLEEAVEIIQRFCGGKVETMGIIE